MKNILLTVLLIVLFNSSTIAQNKDYSFDSIEGIWIQEDFYYNFDRTKSITSSKNVFIPEYPVGLRINKKEIIDSILNIGYSILHDHIRHPEISRCIIQNKDSICEQGSLLVDLRLNNRQLPFNVGYIPFFNNENTNSIFTIINSKNSLKLCLVNDIFDTIKYVRFKKNIDTVYPFPNPLYYYTMNRALTGKYTLLSKDKKVLSSNVTIKDNGEIIGFKDFENKHIYYSTDIYCDMPITYDISEICDSQNPNSSVLNQVCNSYIIKRKKNGNILFYNYDWNNEIALHFRKLKTIKYIFMKLN